MTHTAKLDVIVQRSKKRFLRDLILAAAFVTGSATLILAAVRDLS